MNIIKQIKLYREVKDYVIKNPKAVYTGCRLNCEYGAVDVSYQLNMEDKHVYVVEFDNPTIRPTQYKLTVTYNNGAEEINSGLFARKLYYLMSKKRMIRKQNLGMCR